MAVTLYDPIEDGMRAGRVAPSSPVVSLPCLLTQGETGHPNRYFFLGQPGKEERDCLSPCRNPVSRVRHSITIHEEGVKEKTHLGAGELPQQLRTLTACAEDQCLILRTHVVVYSNL